jgi:hypothetical protein
MSFWTHAKIATWLLAIFLLCIGRYLAAALLIVWLIVPAKKARS